GRLPAQALRVEPPRNRNGAAAQRLAVGDRAPALSLPGLDGEPAEVAPLNGRPTILLFWNPACGFCQQMQPDLERWAMQRGPEEPELLVISSGTPAQNRQINVGGTVLTDAAFRAGNAFGANGTPMAVLLDESGRIASEAVAGAVAVFALARSRGAVEPAAL